MKTISVRARFASLIGAAIFFAGGCEVGPNYQAPVVKVNPSFGDMARGTSANGGAPMSPGSAVPSQPSSLQTSAQLPGLGTTRPSTQPSIVTEARVPPGKWWTAFNDPELNRLVDRAFSRNLDLLQAQSRLRQARYNAAITGAQLYPEINVDGGYNHARGSKNIVIPPGAFGSAASGSSGSSGSKSPGAAPAAATPGGGGVGGGSASAGPSGGPAGPQSPLGQGGLPGVTTDVYQVGFDATWEIDVFGGTRRSVESADAQTMAAVEDSRAVLVSLAAEVARDYVELRGYQRQAAIARENLSLQTDTLDLTRSRYQNGFVTQLDVARQAAQVATTAAEIPPLEFQARSAMHSLGILLGEDPDALAVELDVEAPIPPAPPVVPVGLPSELLRRRPDIRRAERQLAAATAQVGVATADLLPKFTITGLLGLDSTKPEHLFDYNSRYYEFVPGITWPIFDAGKIQNNIHVQDELRQQAALSYQSAILNALKEVEDSLVACRTEQLRRAALIDAVNASREAVELARQQYQRGVIDFLTVLDAQRSLLAAENALVQSDREVSDDIVGLYKALGGGWETGGKS